MQNFRKIVLPQGFHKISLNFILLAIDKTVRFILGFIVGLWTTRYLGPIDYGLYTYVYTIFGLFTALSSLGLDIILVRELVENPKKEKQLLGTGFALGTLGAILASGAALALTFILSTGSLDKIQLIGILSIGYFISSFFVIDWWYQSQVKGHFSVISAGSAYVIISIIKIFLIIFNAPVFWFILCFLLEIVFSASLFLIMYHIASKRSLIQWRFDLNLAKNLLYESWPIVLAGLSTALYMRADQLILGTISKPILGIYSAAARIIELYYFIPTVFLITLFPSIVKTADNPTKFNKRMRFLLSFIFYLSIILSATTSIFSHTIIEFLYGGEFSSSSIILGIYSWAFIPAAIHLVLYYYLVATKNTIVTLYKAIISGVTSLVFSIIFISIAGAKGASFAYILSGIVSLLAIGIFKEMRTFLRLLLEALNPQVLISYLFDEDK